MGRRGWWSWVRAWAAWGLRRVAGGRYALPRRSRLAPERLEDRLAPAAEPTFRGGLTLSSAELTGDGIPDLVGAPGPTAPPLVVAYSGADGAVVGSFFSHEPGFLGGVFVAVGDVTGDGWPEVVAGAGGGGGPRVTVTDPLTGVQLASFFAYEPGFRGGVRVAVADLDGDGVAEVVTAPGEGGGPHVRVFDGAGRNLGRDFFAYATDFRGGVAVAAGDVDGDGAADVITTPGVGGAAHVKVFDGPTGAVLASYLAFDPAARGGAWVAAGDVDGNGLADIVVGAGAGADPVVGVFAGRGTQFAGWQVYESRFRGGVRVAAVDLDGDAFADVLTGPGEGGGPRITAWDGYTFENEQSVFAVTDGGPLGLGLRAPPPRAPLFDGRTLLAPGDAGASVAAVADLLRRFTDLPGEVGLYRVDDAAGAVAGFAPGDPGYAVAALAADRRRPLFSANSGSGRSVAFDLAAGVRYGVYLVRGGSVDDWLATNPANDPAGQTLAVFPFAAANPGAADLFRVGPRNRAAFEDAPGADADLNDAIVAFRAAAELPDPPTLPPPAANTAPTVSDVPDLATTEGVAVGPVGFAVGDAETPAAALVVTAAVSDPLLIPAGNVVVSGSGANRTVTVTPAAGRTGRARVTLTVSDGELTASDSFDVEVTAAAPTNTAPTISAVADQATAAGTAVGPLAFTIGDAETPAANLVVTAASSNPTLLPASAITLGGAGTARTIALAPAAGLTGSATVTLTVSDGELSSTETFAILVQGGELPFPTDLAGWAAAERGGTAGFRGAVAPAAGRAVLAEGDSFVTTLSRSFVVPAGAAPLSFTYESLGFDTSDPGFVNDAFEAALLDAAGNPLVPAFAPGRDAFLNVTDGGAVASAAGVVVVGRTVTLDLSGVPAGTAATLVFRLVNNDRDTGSAVTLATVALPSADPAAAPVKFFVADAAADRAFRYGAEGLGAGGFDTPGVGDVRGAASNPAGDRVWLVDAATKEVSVFASAGGLVGRWVTDAADPQGVAVNNGDLWLVDRGTRTVRRYAGGMGRTSGAAAADAAFALDPANASPSDLVTDGATVWVTDDSAAAVFVYDAAGALLGRWQLDGDNAAPSGITRNPAGGADLWVIDRARKAVFHYPTGANARAGGLGAAGTFDLGAAAVAPEGIADPPPTLSVTSSALGGQAPQDSELLISGVGVAFSPPPSALPPALGLTAPTGFGVSVFASVPRATSLAFAPDGSPFGPDLYVTSFYPAVSETDPGTQPDGVYRVSSAGVATLFSTLLPEADPDDLHFAPPGSAYGEYLYLSANNRDGGRPFDHGGVVQRIDLQGNWTDFTSLVSNLPGDLTAIGQPSGFAFAPGGAYGTSLYIGNSTAYPGDVLRVGTQGEVSVFVTDGTFDGSGRTGLRPDEVAFGPGGDFGTGMYISDVNPSVHGIRTVDPTGRVSPPLVTLPGSPEFMTFAPGGPFGNDLYVGVRTASGGDIYRVRADGSKELFLTGLRPQAGTTFGGIAFSRDGRTMFVADSLADTVYRIESTTFGIPNRIVSVTVNGVEVEALDAGGRFITHADVRPGINTYHVVATDLYGQQASVDLTVTGVGGPAGAVNQNAFVDVTAGFKPEYARTTFREQSRTLYADVAVRNVGNYPTGVPLYAAVRNVSDPAVRVLDAAGTLADGTPYYDFTGLVTGGGALAPGAATGTLSLAFANPNRARFTYDLVFYGVPNRPPAFTSVPELEATVGRAYAYAAAGVDPDGDPLTFTLVGGPAGMTVDPASGTLAWTPVAGQVGAQAVNLRVSDGRGGFAEQTFTLVAAAPRPNRPPVFTTRPATDVDLGSAYEYDADASDPDGDTLSYSLATGAPQGMSIDPATGVISWTPTAAQLGHAAVTVVVADGRGGTATQAFEVCVEDGGNRPPVIVSDPVTAVRLAYADAPAPVDLRAWSVVRYDLPAQGPANWVIDPSGTVARQTDNADASILLSPFSLTADVIEGTWRTTDGDNDFFGFVFGYQDDTHYYLFDWKQGDQGDVLGFAQRGMSVKLVSANSTLTGNDLWPTAGNGSRVQPLFHNTVSWQQNTDYRFRLEFLPGETRITVKQGSTVLAVIPLTDTTYQAGRFGFYNYSQGAVTYTGFTRQQLPSATYAYDVEAVDPDGGPASYSLTQKPDGMTIDPVTGAIAWTAPPALADQTFPVTVQVNDGKGGAAEQRFTVSVVPAGGAAVFDPPASPDLLVSGVAQATSAAGVTFTATVRNDGTPVPAGVSVAFYDGDPAREGRRLGTALTAASLAQGQSGSAAVTVPPGSVNDLWVVADDDGTGLGAEPEYDETNNALRAGIDLDPADYAPRFTRPLTQGETAATANAAFRLRPRVLDPDAGLLTFDLLNAPEGMLVHPTLGVVAWVPARDQVGTHQVVLRATDPAGNVTLLPFEVTVAAPNTAPVFVTTPPATAAAPGRPYEYRSAAQDAEQPALTYSLRSPLPGMSVDPATGVFTWTPTAAQAGTRAVILVASDGSLEAVQTFSLVVSAPTPNTAPAATVEAPAAAPLGQPWVGRVAAADPDGDPVRFSLVQGPAGMTVDPVTGVVRWTPAALTGTAELVVVAAADGRGGEGRVSFSVTATARVENQPPVVTSNPPRLAVVGSTYAYDLAAADPDGGPVVWSLVAGPQGMSLDPVRGTLRWVPAPDQDGEVTVTVRATDQLFGTGEQTFTVSVACANLPPELTSRPPTVAYAGDPYVYAVRATDPEGDPLTFSLDAAPAGMAFVPGTSLIRWTPTLAQAGPQPVVVRVTDRAGNVATQAFTVAVSTEAPNRPPVVTSRSPVLATVGRPYSYTPVATDPDGDPLTYRLADAPEGMAIDASGLITWTPAAPANPTVTVEVTDGRGGVAVQSFTLTARANRPPELTPLPDATAAVGAAFRAAVRATDPEADPLTYTLVSAVPGMTIDREGRISWTAAGPPRTETVQVVVADSAGLLATDEFALTVVNDTEAPVVQIDLSRTRVGIGGTVSVHVRATDDVGVAATALTANGVPVTLSADNRATVTPDAAGRVMFVATATDGSGNVSTATAELLVFDPAAGSAVTAAITRLDLLTAPGTYRQIDPTQGVAKLSYLTEVVGTVQSTGNPLAEWRLVYAPAEFVDAQNLDPDAPAWRTIAQGTSPVVNGRLGTFDPTLLPNDPYVIAVVAYDVLGHGYVSGIDVALVGNAKLGEFRLDFTDLSIPLNGIPVQITRSYDTRLSGEVGDFGYGWTIGVRDARIRETVPPGPGDGLFSAGHPFVPGRTKVYLTNPAGERVGFTYTEVLVSAGLFSANYRPVYVPDPGVTDRLESDGFIVRGLFGFFDYNPDAYRLTTPDGLTYSYDQFAGLQRIDDRNGNFVTFSPTAITHSGGRVITLDRDGQGRVTAVHLPDGSVAVRYRYDAAGNLVEVRQVTEVAPVERALVSTFTYRTDRPHYLDEYFDANGRRAVKTEYDAAGRVVAVIDADGNRVEQDFSGIATFTETVRDGRGNPTLITYNDRGNVTRTVQPTEFGDVVTQYAYDDAGNPDKETRVVNPRGFATTRSYDSRGNLLAETTPDGTTTYAYNALNKLTRVTDPLNRTTAYAYDPAGNLVRVVNPLGDDSAFTYDPLGRVSSFEDFAGNVTLFSDYCACGRPLTTTNPDGTVRRIETNGYSQVTKVTDEEGHVTQNVYDQQGRLVRVVDGEGNATRYEYEGANQTKVIDPLGHETTYAYDGGGRRTRITDAEGGVTTFSYDANGNLETVTDPVNNLTRFVYDAANRLKEEIDPLGASRLYEYDAAGNRVQATDRNGRVRTFVYDPMNRVTAENWLAADGSVVRVLGSRYDRVGNLLEASDPDATLTYTYDPLNRVATATTEYPGTNVPVVTLAYGYDANGNRTSVADNTGVRVDSHYGDRNQLEWRTWQGGGVDAVRVAFDYFANGERKTLERFADLAGTVQVGSTDYTYYRNGLSETIAHRDGAGVLLVGYDYEYDAAGRLVQETHHGDSYAYGYDRTGQLLTVVKNGSLFESFSYDANGNRLTSTGPNGSQTYQPAGPGNQLLDDGLFRYTYDREGNLKTKTDIATGEVTEYTWDYRNRLVKVEQRSEGGIILSLSEYSYDTQGRRISQIIPGEVLRTVFDGEHAWTDFVATGAVDARFMFGARTDEILARWMPTAGNAWYLADRLGSIRNVGGPAGSVINAINYAAFGQLISMSNPAAEDRFAFTGRERNATGDYFYRARYFDPATGQFLSSDPLGFAANDYNLRRYIQNSAPNGTDPSGKLTLIQYGILLGVFTTGFNIGAGNNLGRSICYGIAVALIPVPASVPIKLILGGPCITIVAFSK